MNDCLNVQLSPYLFGATVFLGAFLYDVTNYDDTLVDITCGLYIYEILILLLLIIIK